MNKQQENQTQRQCSIEDMFRSPAFGGLSGSPVAPFKAPKPKKTDIEVMREKLLVKYNRLVEEKTKKMTWEQAIGFYEKIIAVMQTQLETYGHTFG